MLVLTEIETAMRLVTLILLFREGRISRAEFQKAAQITPEAHVLFEAQIERRMKNETEAIRAERN